MPHGCKMINILLEDILLGQEARAKLMSDPSAAPSATKADHCNTRRSEADGIIASMSRLRTSSAWLMNQNLDSGTFQPRARRSRRLPGSQMGSSRLLEVFGSLRPNETLKLVRRQLSGRQASSTCTAADMWEAQAVNRLSACLSQICAATKGKGLIEHQLHLEPTSNMQFVG